MPGAADVSQELFDAATIHEIDVRRYGQRTVREILGLLDRADADLVRQIQDALGNEAKKTRIEGRLAAIRKTNREVYNQFQAMLGDAMDGLSGAEARFQGSMIEGARQALSITAVFDAPSTEQMVAAVRSRPFQGKYLKEWVSGLEAGKFERVRDALRIGYVEGEGVDDIVRRLRGTKAYGYKDGILNVSKRSAEAVVRTALTHTTNTAVELTAKRGAEAGVVRAVRWSSILDGRTSAVCRARDGQVFPLDSGPRPPAHWNCRSRLQYVLVGEPDEPRRMTYQQWLGRQDVETQDYILGKTKGQLFRKGGLEVSQFVDSRGRELTLQELREKLPKAFERAAV